MIDVLAISHACFTAVNRTVYRELARRGWSVEVVVPRQLDTGVGMRPAEPEREGDPPVHFLELIGASPRSYTFGGLRGLLERLRPRLVLLDNDPASRVALEVGLWAKLRGAKLVCLSCENQSQRLLALARRRGGRAAVGGVIKKALTLAVRPLVSEVFVISRDGITVQAEQGYQGRITLTPVGFDPTLFRPDPEVRAAVRARLGLEGVTLAYFGRMRPEKGVHLLVEAARRLAAEGVAFQLLLDEFGPAGSDYERDLARQLDEGGLGDRVVRFSARHGEMPGYMNAADVVALPSIATPWWVEQYGRVAPEAMACGRVVVVAETGALPELVGAAGATFPEGDVAALTRVLRELIADPLRREVLGAAAAERAHAELSVTRQVAITERVIERLIGGPRASR